MTIVPLDFTRCKALIAEYHARSGFAVNSADDLVTREAAQRIRDLERLTHLISAGMLVLIPAEIQSAQAAIEELMKSDDPKLGELRGKKLRLGNFARAVGASVRAEESKEDRTMQEVRIHTEAFYYFAHRLKVCLCALPGLKNYDCKPVRVVRNQLLEHPERRDSRVLFRNFGFDSKNGPLVKPVRFGGQADLHADAGFIPNCRDLIQAVETALDQALAKLPPAPATASGSANTAEPAPPTPTP